MPPMVRSVRAAVRRAVPLAWTLPLYNFFVAYAWRLRGFRTTCRQGLFRIRKGRREIRLSREHAVYLQDTLEHFDFYFGGVHPTVVDGIEVVDYSHPAWHSVPDFDLFPVRFRSVAEPVSTALQYLSFAELGPGAVALDLGAYSAFTSILMDQRIETGGGVLAVEPDPGNLEACRLNLDLYRRMTGRKIELLPAAVWNHDGDLRFSAEGSMGSSAVEVVGIGRGPDVRVDGTTLSGLVERYGLERVDFIKCDVEGAEAIALDDPRFFGKFRPRIVVECHWVAGVSTEAAVRAVLERFGYSCESRTQVGYPLPLLFCRSANGTPASPG